MNKNIIDMGRKERRRAVGRQTNGQIGKEVQGSYTTSLDNLRIEFGSPG